VVDYRSQYGGWVELALGYDILDVKLIDDSLGVVLPVMVLLSPFALARRNQRVTDTFIMGAAQLLILISLAPTARLAALGIIPLAILGAIAIADVWRASGRIVRAALAAIAGAGMYVQLMLVAFLFVSTWSFLPYLIGVESQDAYLLRTRDFYKPYAWIAENTPRDAKLFLLAENRTFYLERRSLAAGNLDGPRVAAYLDQFRNEDDLLRDLRRQEVTYMLLHRPWYRVDAGARANSPTEKEYILAVPPRVDALLHRFAARDTRRVYDDGVYVIYELRRDAG
jgi:hypothetical protein